MTQFNFDKIDKQYYGLGFLVIILTIILFFPTIKDGFTNFTNNVYLGTNNAYPATENVPLLYKDYPVNFKHNGVSDKTYSDIWWEYPSFGVGSFKQLTNNLKYFKNPDEGTCVGAEFCNAMYKNKAHKTNVVYPLPPVQSGPGMRVGYYRTPSDLVMGSSPGSLLELPAF
jgi:hypothetical protein